MYAYKKQENNSFLLWILVSPWASKKIVVATTICGNTICFCTYWRHIKASINNYLGTNLSPFNHLPPPTGAAVTQKRGNYLKYGFCNKVISERWNSDQLTTFTTYLSSLLDLIAEYNSNHAQNWWQICCESVQLIRFSSFRNDFVTKSIL